MKKTIKHHSNYMSAARVLALLGLVIGAFANPQEAHAATRCYVNAAVVGGANNGSSWTNAYKDLQSALGSSSCTEVWVAAGTYRRDTTGLAFPLLASFTLKSGVSIYGGFAGGETLLSQRKPATNVTTLSGDIGIPSDVNDNTYHVVTGSYTDSTAVLDGFTITGGNASSTVDYSEGGGMYNLYGYPTLANMTFYNNHASAGGGMYNDHSSPTLINVIFDHNTAFGDGGGMNNYLSNPTLTNVTFDTNSAYIGGGMYNYSDAYPPLLTNVTFSGNSASDGGAIYNYSSSPTLTNVTFSGNSATGIYPSAGGMVNNNSSNPTIYDSIFWPVSDKIFNTSSTPTIVDSIIYDGCPNPPGPDCTNIINSDPHLGPLASNGGYTKTMALGAGSSAIDAGGVNCATKDQRGVTRPQGRHCDIGAFEAKPPAFSSTLTSWNYGLIKVGTTSAGKVFTIKNTGEQKLVIGTVKLAGSNTGLFHLTVNHCSGHSLAPNATCSITATFNSPTTGAKTAYINIPDNAAGHPHKIQLGGKGATEQSLNGGFNTYAGTSKIPTNWVGANLAATDGKDSVTKKEGAASVWIRNTAAKTKTLTQTRNVSGGVGSSFLFSLWGKGKNIPTTAGVVQAQVLLYNGSTLWLTKTITFPNNTYSFAQKSLAFTTTHAYNKIVIKLTYSKGGGSIWFDGLSLLRSP